MFADCCGLYNAVCAMSSLWRRHVVWLLCRRVSARHHSSLVGDRGRRDEETLQPRISPLGIPMLSEELHQRIFGRPPESASEDQVQVAVDHLRQHGLWGKPCEVQQEPCLDLPTMHGSSLDDHFRHIASKQTAPYRKLASQLISGDIPAAPAEWLRTPGWTKYSPDGSAQPVAFPDCDAFVFDVEVVVRRRTVVMATAVSPVAWYGWVSARICDGASAVMASEGTTLGDLVPLDGGCSRPRLVVGHHVGYDRSWVREQYLLQTTGTRFLDTMSMHVAVGGINSVQRAQMVARQRPASAAPSVTPSPATRKRKPPSMEWMTRSSLNSLGDVYKLYCGQTLDKDPRNVFVSGDFTDVVSSFNELMVYCANDSRATWCVLRELWPQFKERFPHPVTLAGTLEMGQTYLPVTSDWNAYIRICDETYQDLENELTVALRNVANSACAHAEKQAYRDDPWLWDLDWSVKPLKIKKEPVKVSKKRAASSSAASELVELPANWDCPAPAMTAEEFASDVTPADPLEAAFAPLWNTVGRLYKCQPTLPGYPAWYRELCNKDGSGLTGLTASKRCVPKLLRLTWCGYPLHYDVNHGWGYLVPGRKDSDSAQSDFPLESLKQMVDSRSALHLPNDESSGLDDDEEIPGVCNMEPGRQRSKEVAKFESPPLHIGNQPLPDVVVGGCWFFPLPHKDGEGNNVGNPLSKHFLSKVEDGTLSCAGGASAERVLRITQKISYWRNSHDRIRSQNAVFLRRSELPRSVLADAEYSDQQRYGAILPQVAVAGTLTRRAVERTWLTASNPRADRLGSELRAMVRAPAGFRLVGADVDSQELWIAALIGDAAFAGQHGGTAFSWMTLQGSKAQATDLHSRTASVIGVTRDQAKVLNYGRIYGGAKPFAAQLLRQFNPTLSAGEVTSRVASMYQATKGVRRWRLSGRGRTALRKLQTILDGEEEGAKVAELLQFDADKPLPATAVSLLVRLSGGGNWKDFVGRCVWHGGSESHMFNRLESIAAGLTPSTPVLGSRLSRGLEPASVGDNYVTSRVNWVVQSSAVDFLHLMLVSMRWLMDEAGLEGRFCISIHDEVRYLIRSEHVLRAALALQITNLLTRCMFSEQLGMPDLPQSVAFFSAVDVDRVLRKDVNDDCKTPSNPHGLAQGYGVPQGESLDIHQLVDRIGGSLLP